MELDLGHIRTVLANHTHERVTVENIRRRAAVAAVVRPGGVQGPEVLLMRRAEREGDQWSGQMAFPGGHLEAGEDFEDAAIRETNEEVGLDLAQHGRIIGALDETHAYVRARRLDMVVAPIVFELVREPPPLVHNYEVAETLWAPLAPMMGGERDTKLLFEMDGEAQRFPGYDVEGRVVWGLTYRMLGTLFAALQPEWRPPPD